MSSRSSSIPHYQEPSPMTEDCQDPQKSCCICYTTYTTTSAHGSEEPIQLACGHVFGATCIQKWMLTKNTCPLCRTEINWSKVSYGFKPWHNEYESRSEAFRASSTYPTDAPQLNWQADLGTNSAVQDPHSHLEDIWLDPETYQSNTAEDIWLDPQTYTLHQPNTTKPHHHRTHPRRHSARRKNPTSYRPVDDIWISAVEHEYLGGSEFTASSSRTRVHAVERRAERSCWDSLFDGLLAAHEQWMRGVI